MKFIEFPKMSRLSREMIITEKIDGTNASVFIQNKALEEDLNDPSIIFETDEYTLRAGSRTKWITQQNDNYGFANWVYTNRLELLKLGEGMHFGEWWGKGINTGYNMKEKVFSLFNAQRWVEKVGYSDILGEKQEYAPMCCRVVPILYKGIFSTVIAEQMLSELAEYGSRASPGFMHPEGIVVWHTAGNFGLKKTIKKDESPKSLV